MEHGNININYKTSKSALPDIYALHPDPRAGTYIPDNI